MKTRRVIKAQVPQEIWDADQSWWNRLTGRHLVAAWIKSIRATIDQINKKDMTQKQPDLQEELALAREAKTRHIKANRFEIAVHYREIEKLLQEQQPTDTTVAQTLVKEMIRKGTITADQEEWMTRVCTYIQDKIEENNNNTKTVEEINNNPDRTTPEDNKQDWNEIYDEYSREQWPPFGGPFTNATSLIDWLKQNYESPERLKQ